METTDLEKNQLIANFMGYHVSDNQIKDENGFWVDANVFKNSWDWLMPVIARITYFSEEPQELDELELALLCVDIESTYTLAVEFIEQYNQ